MAKAGPEQRAQGPKGRGGPVRVVRAAKAGAHRPRWGGPIQHQDVSVIDKDTSDEIRRIEEHIAQLEEEIELDGR